MSAACFPTGTGIVSFFIHQCLMCNFWGQLLGKCFSSLGMETMADAPRPSCTRCQMNVQSSEEWYTACHTCTAHVWTLPCSNDFEKKARPPVSAAQFLCILATQALSHHLFNDRLHSLLHAPGTLQLPQRIYTVIIDAVGSAVQLCT